MWKNLIGSRWVEIDTDAIRFNYEQVKLHLKPEVHVLGVVKADAYGLGAVEVARVLIECGVTMLGVTTVDEGIELREYGIDHPILIFSPFLPGEERVILKFNLTPAVSSIAQVKALARLANPATKIAVHLKIETGMGRTGLLPEEVKPFLEEAAAYPELQIEGIFTHFAQACRGDAFTVEQYAKFVQAVQTVEEMGHEVHYRHACNSAATLDLPEMHLNMVRVGTVLYGQNPAKIKNKLKLQDPWQLKARVVHLKKIKERTSVGYGRDYIAGKSTTIAVIPLGWADGLTVMPAIKPKGVLDLLKMVAKLILEYFGQSKTSSILIGERQFPLVGRLGMQLSMAEVDSQVKVGDEARVNIRRLSTNPRLPRVYFRASKPYLARTSSGELSLDKYVSRMVKEF